jgi:hypothetical protein
MIPDHDGDVQHRFDCVTNLDVSSPAEYIYPRCGTKRIYSKAPDEGSIREKANETWNRNDGFCRLEVEGTERVKLVKSHWRKDDERQSPPSRDCETAYARPIDGYEEQYYSVASC